MSEIMVPGAPSRLELEFDDNTLLPGLYGQHDRHLARIEQQLDVSLASRGNRVMIKGTSERIEATRQVLSALYDRLKHAKVVGRAEVDDAIRMLGAPHPLGGGNPGAGIVRTRKRLVSPRSPAQATYVEALLAHDLVFALGPAGTGKTYLAVAVAVSMLVDGKVDRIILSRPAVEAGEKLGFLPGDMREKVDPYLRPLYDALYDMLPGDAIAKRMEKGDIEVAPLAFMRGRTLANAYVILDEAQNTTAVQMKMFLTRLGENSRMAVTGDPTQIDLPRGIKPGLLDAVETVAGMEGVACIHFTDRDVVRHPLVSRIVKAYGARAVAADADTAGK
ncbi:MAG: phosphate starvation-inducible protein PhoH [Alphaproteobacteria bacterium]|nr:phosphate starvation-inducible protein PhoH [Alphaproteobacteria bacterium]